MVISCKKPCKKKRSTMLTVEQMVDIALGTPEIGAVNFNVLHALIHVVVQQLNIQKCLVEFKGYDSERMEGIILSAKPGPILKLSEYMIDVSDEKRPCPPKGRGKRDEAETSEGESSSPKKMSISVEKKKQKEEEKEKTEEKDAGKGKKEEDPKKKKERATEECEEVEEPEPKKVREVKKDKKPCPCKGKESDVAGDDTFRAPSSDYYASDIEKSCQTIVRVEPVGERCDSWRSRPALAHESMVKLEEKVAMLQDAFEALEQMPTNEELKKKTAGTGSSTPVKDLWQIYNLNKRVESCEGTIEKMASMIEDLVKETCNFREAMLVIADTVDEMECSDSTKKAFYNPCAATTNGAIAVSGTQNETDGAGGTGGTGGTGAETNPKPCPDNKEEGTKSQGVKIVMPVFVNPPRLGESEAPKEGEEPAEEARTQEEAPTESGEPGAAAPPANLADLLLEEGTVPQHPQVGIGPEFFKMTTSEKFCVLKSVCDCLLQQMKAIYDVMSPSQIASKLCAIHSLQKQLDALEKEWRNFLNSFGKDGPLNAIQNLSEEMENLNASFSKMLADLRDQEEQMRAIMKDIENLKVSKADVHLMEDLLAEKADASTVNKKVSHDQFDAACNDLTRGLDEALERLMQQEAMWNEAMEEIQKDVDNKLDKNEIMPLKEFITKKLKCLQEKLKQLVQMRKDAEAAGAKSRILRNLNCIACDGDVVMKMDNAAFSQRPTLAPSKGLKPMLTYELDQVRKAMKKGPCRPVNHVEEALFDLQKKATGLPLTSREGVDKKVAKLTHFCNRYCGGSHTITTPQQRVTRIGHFLTEFGPQALAMFNQDQEPCEESKEQVIETEEAPPEEDPAKNC